MADDAKYGKPTAGGGGLDWGNPWVKYGTIAAGALLVYWLWKRRQGAAQNQLPAITGTDQATPSIDPNTGLPTQSFAVNPVTGLPINPATGLDFSQIGSASNSLGQWITAAYNAIVGAGASPTAADQALYDLMQGNTLTTTEQHLIDIAQKAAGAPPGGVWNTGNTTGTTTPPPPPTAKPLSLMQQYVNAVYAYLHRNTKTYKGPIFTAAQIQLAKQDVKSGQAALPAGFTAPAGYTLNPTTRILTPIKTAA